MRNRIVVNKSCYLSDMFAIGGGTRSRTDR